MNHPHFKLALYLLSILVTEFVTRAEPYTSAEVNNWDWWDWTKFSAGIVAALVIAWRMFLDQSVARHAAELAAIAAETTISPDHTPGAERDKK